MDIRLSADSLQVVLVFAGYLVAVMGLGILSHRYLAKGSFVKEYFLGNRGLGGWVLALTIAATAISGGTFMGFPSLIYTNGWIMAVWIASYMIVPLTTMALLGKRLNQIGRIGGAVTLPDVFRDRFRSPALGMTATLIILICLLFNLVAQFKAGGLVMRGAMQLPAHKVDFLHVSIDQGYLLGLLIFAATVVAYTTYGGFWAVTWTDVFEGMVMLVGVVIMAVLAVRAVPPISDAHGNQLHGLAAATEKLRQIDVKEQAVANQKRIEVGHERLVHGPGPNNYLPLAMAISFFCMWGLMSPGQPSGMVRLMAFKDVPSLKRALLLIAFYYILVYLSLLVIFICARAIFPTEYLGKEGNEARGEPDSIMPEMVRHLTRERPWVGGLLLAAPYAAIMSTVAAFLLMISSSLVRDLYQRFGNPNASNRTLKFGSYTVTALVGIGVMIAALDPPEYLQYLIVFTGSAQGCAFLLPMAFVLYWRRATGPGILAGMLGGFVVVFGLYALGWLDSASQTALQKHSVQVTTAKSAGQTAPEPPAFATALNNTLGWMPGWGEKRSSAFNPLFVGGFEPLIWGLLAALLLCVGVSLLSRPDPELVKKYFPE